MIKDIFVLQNPWLFKKNYNFQYKKRSILNELINNLDNKKMIGLIGSRQVGKSSLIYLLIEYLLHKKNINEIFYFNLDNLFLHKLFNNITELLQFIKIENTKKYIFIDEIQRLKNPGLFLKELYDLNLPIKIIYSGSSQLDLKSKLKEHMVGRTREFIINRLTYKEYESFSSYITKEEIFTQYLTYGSYPEICLEASISEKKLLLKDIYQTYIEKDITDFLKIDNINAFNKCLILLANKIGNLLNIENLSKILKVSRNNIEKYISILENTYIIKLIYPFYKNYKKEIRKTPKIFFLDLGLRNFILKNFNPLDIRNDIGSLFENFHLLQILGNDFNNTKKINYWRTTNQTEIDFIIEDENIFEAIEIKYKKTSIPKSFRTIKTYYPNINTKLITKNHYI